MSDKAGKKLLECKAQRDAWLSLASHYLSSSAVTSISAVQCMCEILANGRCERPCTCPSASPSLLLTCGSHQVPDCADTGAKQEAVSPGRRQGIQTE